MQVTIVHVAVLNAWSAWRAIDIDRQEVGQVKVTDGVVSSMGNYFGLGRNSVDEAIAGTNHVRCVEPSNNVPGIAGLGFHRTDSELASAE